MFRTLFALFTTQKRIKYKSQVEKSKCQVRLVTPGSIPEPTMRGVLGKTFRIFPIGAKQATHRSSPV